MSLPAGLCITLLLTLSHAFLFFSLFLAGIKALRPPRLLQKEAEQAAV